MWDDFFESILNHLSFKIYTSTSEFPEDWDTVAESNHFLQTPYLNVLEQSAPVNMECFFIGVFENEELIGTALAQYVKVSALESFGERDKCFKTIIRNLVFKNFASHVLFIGNNMITGQNGYAFSKEIDFQSIADVLIQGSEAIVVYFKEKKINIHLISFKDFYQPCAIELKKFQFQETYEFNTQPNMIVTIPNNWKKIEDYVDALQKKYRDQFKRARKKLDGVEVRELNLDEVIYFENRIYELYHYVAKNAPFNTFFLAKNHFSIFKKQCGQRFKLFGYFLNEKLVGFHTVLLNEKVLETYFLGYDDKVQKENMLYLNMLYNMLQLGIENNFAKIIFGRTALEIKSSIGAKPVSMSGFIIHRNKLINKFLPKIFPKLEPETHWQQRHPFK